MNIAILVNGNEHRNGSVDGVSMRDGGVGISGTDTSAVLLAESLVKLGHRVVVACDKKNPTGRINGVEYTDFRFSTIAENDRTFDYLINTLWFEDYDSLPVRVTNALVQWCHMQYVYGVENIKRYCSRHSLRCGIVHISSWSRDRVADVVNHLGKHVELFEATIHNMLPFDMLESLKTTKFLKNKRSVVFHAAWRRGGDVVADVVSILNSMNSSKDWKLEICSYIGRAPKTLSMMRDHGPLDKSRLYSILAKTEYFVYPCVDLHSLDVHMDTFSCVVAEALAMGCTVVAYRLGCLEELYGPCIEFVDFPVGIDANVMATSCLVKSRQLANHRDGIVNKIIELDKQSIDEKTTRMNRNRDFIFTKFGTGIEKNQWIHLLHPVSSKMEHTE